MASNVSARNRFATVDDAHDDRLRMQLTVAANWVTWIALRTTVVLLACGIFLVFAGTLAQEKKDIWEVMQAYFRCWFAWIDFQVFFVRAFFNGEPPHVPGGFYFPGGFIIGGLLGLNLLATYVVRFILYSVRSLYLADDSQASFKAQLPRVLGGLAVIAVGVVLTWMVVEGGSGKDTIEGRRAVRVVDDVGGHEVVPGRPVAGRFVWRWCSSIAPARSSAGRSSWPKW